MGGECEREAILICLVGVSLVSFISLGLRSVKTGSIVFGLISGFALLAAAVIAWMY